MATNLRMVHANSTLPAVNSESINYNGVETPRDGTGMHSNDAIDGGILQ